MPRHTCSPSSLVRANMCCVGRFSFPQSLTGARLKEGRKDACSLETVSLLKDQAEVYAALQFGNGVALPPEGVVVDIVPLNSYKAELSPTLNQDPNVPEFMSQSFASQTQHRYFVKGT